MNGNRLRRILEAVREALEDSRKGRRWVNKFIGQMRPKDIERAVRENRDVWAEVHNHYALGDQQVHFLVSALVKRHWREIEDELTDVSKLYQRLSRNPLNRKVLERSETKRWLNWTAKRCYNSLYYWAYGVDAVCWRCKAKFPVFPPDYEPGAEFYQNCPCCNAELRVALK